MWHSAPLYLYYTPRSRCHELLIEILVVAIVGPLFIYKSLSKTSYMLSIHKRQMRSMSKSVSGPRASERYEVGPILWQYASRLMYDRMLQICSVVGSATDFSSTRRRRIEQNARESQFQGNSEPIQYEKLATVSWPFGTTHRPCPDVLQSDKGRMRIFIDSMSSMSLVRNVRAVYQLSSYHFSRPTVTGLDTP